ncbi:MAG: two-component regulator propeller domain-containing protein [bacterium]|nr:two-component regulator propeller domain-containing protein [bacterium]
MKRIHHPGNIWAGTVQGAGKYDGKKWAAYTTDTTEGGLIADYVHSIAEDENGNLWFSTRKGVSKYDWKDWRSYTELDS